MVKLIPDFKFIHNVFSYVPLDQLNLSIIAGLEYPINPAPHLGQPLTIVSSLMGGGYVYGLPCKFYLTLYDNLTYYEKILSTEDIFMVYHPKDYFSHIKG